MYWYKKIIQSGSMKEVMIYKSIRKVDAKHNHRCLGKKKLTPEKQRIRNVMEMQRRTQRYICNNFTTNDIYVTLTFAEKITDEKCKKEFDNFIKRTRRWCKSNGIEFKAIGCRERGKNKGRWHSHIVMTNIPCDTLRKKLWSKKYGGLKIEGLYEEGAYKKLAQYITKEVTGKRQMFQTKNLKKPVEKVYEITSRNPDVKRIKKGEVIREPKDYITMVDQCSTHINDLTGESVRMVYIHKDFYWRNCYGRL